MATATEKQTRVEYQEVRMDSIISYYATGFDLEGAQVSRCEWFYDAGKQTVVLKLFIDPNESEAPHD